MESSCCFDHTRQKRLPVPTWRLELCSSSWQLPIWHCLAYWPFVQTGKMHGAMVCQPHRLIVEKPPLSVHHGWWQQFLAHPGQRTSARLSSGTNLDQFIHKQPANRFVPQVHLCRPLFVALSKVDILLKSSVRSQQCNYHAWILRPVRAPGL